ncbi:hypothetical protein P7D22_21470 [Lichenihabitans sp. Uapishka_5]|uniref:hypothetical protein n=1 Tax=Lichenihabitans sp. Uapishka_5 TaxID=3037302 RepID=UPI0029E7DFE8|nr:hypothetical protein [Lichenihabitans sp. Uapishka_5]MDX7953738.1 hypothetical protein [Lichenihabitans sp. Uapishka_5]
MSDKLSPSIHLAYRAPGYDVTATQIEEELFTISHGAVGRIAAGMSVKAQLQQAWTNLGRPSWWRLKSAWYRDGSGAWSAAAVFDFQERYRRFLAQEQARVDHQRAMDAAKHLVIEPASVTLGRAEFQDLITRISALEAVLR